jgi:hypothetical protein
MGSHSLEHVVIEQILPAALAVMHVSASDILR